ncbi:ATP-dependent DNA helicase srs2 [Gnomoniopsis smithogilvyi]|uniref:DNA 3'-5' helicase n=1 Tax=Gnomoniopsis smithogilvyi TaxID=1191159 RepID=A0A9W8YUY5_9PEZI|nr:ATP-dependent DNA helicase srs2 [Gnomoniopsis smithogilvyi]
MAGQQRCPSILDTLNEAQCRAVCSEAATVAIMAGPGSGKTHTLTSRVVCLIDKVGLQPQNVIVATFTVKAAREMRERIGKALGGGREHRMILGTFHSIARRYLAAYGKHIGMDQKFSIADDGDSRAIINRICKRLQLGIDPPMVRAWISKRKAKGLEWKPTQLKRKHSGEAAEGARAFETCYQEYQDHLERSNLLDYDDLLVRCVELLQKHPACVSNVEAVLIDEYQDTNGVQYDLMRLLAQKHNRITIVGDPDQSIYGWRSAEIGNLRRLFEDFPRTDQIALEENYRSSQSILDTALSVIQQDSKRFQKILKPVHDKGTRPTLRRLKTSSDEARWIVSEIRRIQLMSGQMMGHGDVAILLRSAALSRQIESALGKAGIAYKMVGGFKFYERLEIKTLLDYLRVIHQPENNDALARIINTPKRGIGDTTVKALVEEAERSSQSLWTLLVKHCRGDRAAKTKIQKVGEQKISGELIRLVLDIQKKTKQPPNDSPYGLIDIIDEVLTRLNFEKHLQDTYREPEDHEQRWANVQEFRALGVDFTREMNAELEEELPEIDGVEQVKDSDVLGKFLSNVSLASDAQKQGQDQDATAMVTISTIHAAKGLEWPVVFIPAAYIGSIPHARSEDLDEERRLLYVAMTRAKALLYLSCPLVSTSYSGQSEVELSNFLEPVAKSFSKVGPDLESARLETIGRILGRNVPTPQSIYDGLPGGFCPNDNAFPVDPTAQEYASDRFPQWTESSCQPQRKRPRLNIPRATADSSGETAWVTPYSTTMDQRPSFTMSAQVGFVTAGAHQAALASVERAPKTLSSQFPPQKSKRGTPGGQTTLLGFVKRDSTKSSEVEPATSHTGLQTSKMMSHFEVRDNATGPEQMQLPAIDPALARHRISSRQRSTHKYSVPAPEASEPKAHYTPFSSPPPEAPTAAVNLRCSEDLGSARNPPIESRSLAPRPATSFHNTTVNKQKTIGGIKRPAGLAAPRDEAAALQKLRKPFRPLSINRS